MTQRRGEIGQRDDVTVLVKTNRVIEKVRQGLLRFDSQKATEPGGGKKGSQEKEIGNLGVGGRGGEGVCRGGE